MVYRSDKSGTTFNFTNYLSKANPEWQSVMGEGLSVKWKVGEGGEGNSGVAKKVVGTPNAIGYMDLAELQKRGLTYTKMKNRDGVAVSPSSQSFAAAAASAKWNAANGFYEILTDEPGKESWPITAATFILLESAPTLPEHAAEIMRFFDWAYRDGGELAKSLHYVPLPDSVSNNVRNMWKTQITDSAGKALWR